MRTRNPSSSRVLRGLSALVLCVLLAGCGASQPPLFKLNVQGLDPDMFRVTGREKDDDAVADKKKNQESLRTISTVLVAFFGEPDAPYVLPQTELDPRNIEMAAGPAGGDKSGKQRGLYRQHCAHCHGISGDGAGPTSAFLNPYPRDYRQGIFKFKSTERPAKPTTADMRRILVEGVAGTAMPSFMLLPDAEIDALVEYVKYLSIRGQTEELLRIALITNEETVELKQNELVEQFVLPVVESWKAAESAIIVPPDPPSIATQAELDDSIAKGAELFRGDKAQCTKCHGPTALGDGSDERLFDDWNKVKKYDQLVKQIAEAQRVGDAQQVKDLRVQLAIDEMSWLLPQREIQPRNLRMGVYRFGRTPADHFRRVFAGINGTPMPQGGADPSNPKGLTGDEIWHIVNYVRSLPYQPMSDPQVGRGGLAHRSELTK